MKLDLSLTIAYCAGLNPSASETCIPGTPPFSCSSNDFRTSPESLLAARRYVVCPELSARYGLDPFSSRN
jgi:hypothetical protein